MIYIPMMKKYNGRMFAATKTELPMRKESEKNLGKNFGSSYTEFWYL